jgi:HlyD family secretion protein
MSEERKVSRAVVAAAALAVVMATGFGWRMLFSADDTPDETTVAVVSGTYTDIVEIRGQVEPVRSLVVVAPFGAGELQILKIVRSGESVQAGDIVVEFDAVTLRRTIQEKQGELRSAQAELERHDAQARITLEERRTAVATAEFDVTRAELALGEIGLVSEIDAERNRLAYADAQQRLEEAKAALESEQANVRTERDIRQRAVEKVRAELDRAERQVASLHVLAPASGAVNVLPNRFGVNPVNPTPQEFRAGDRAYPGAPVVELPDLSSVFLTARIDEADRGQLQETQIATVRVDAIADRDYRARVVDISVLARTDFTGGWPPQKQFDLTLAIEDPDDRLRPGMSGNARIEVGRLENALIVPPSAVVYESGRTVVYRQTRRGFEPVPVEILRQGREQAAVSGGLAGGDRVARTRPGAETGEAQ